MPKTLASTRTETQRQALTALSATEFEGTIAFQDLDLIDAHTATYVKASSTSNLPGFVTINPPIQFGSQNYGSAFLPAVYQGTRILPGNEPIANLNTPEGVSDEQQRGNGLTGKFCCADAA